MKKFVNDKSCAPFYMFFNEKKELQIIVMVVFTFT